ncbi:hypothetical protein PMAYCL1PPCAC_31016, partial [Pristionchus mayeri]
MTKLTYYPYQHPGDRPKTEKAVWTWHNILFDEARNALQNSANELTIGLWAPIGAFNGAPLRKQLLVAKGNDEFEVELPPTDKMRTQHLESSVRPVWIAELLHTIGYFVLLRWCEARHSDGVFWIHTAHVAPHAVGFTSKNESGGYRFVPPEAIFNNQPAKQWIAYATERVQHRLAPNEILDNRGNDILFNKFRVGERVETVHEDETSVLVPATVKRV